MQPLYFTLGIIAVIFIAIVYGQIAAKKRLIIWMKIHYGKKPGDKEYNWKNIREFWNSHKESIPEDEKMDDVTWNDLDMNLVFQRINNCNSFAGEQILYHTLHCLPKNKQANELLENKINFFDKNSQERENTQLLLSSLGKADGSYSLPMLMNNLDMVTLPGIWGYRIMQILLILSILPSFIFQNPNLLFITLGIFVINMIVYIKNKIKYETYLNTLGSILQIVKFAGKLTNTNKFSYENKFKDLKDLAVPFKNLNHLVGRIQSKKEISLTGNAEAIFFDYIIGATLWDFIIYNKIIRILMGKQKLFMELYKKVGEIDMCISISSFRESLPFYCTPTFIKEHKIQMEDIYHPLIDEPICNTVQFNNNCIITGSNASGKSTFIKAVTINSILAQNINTCMAKDFTLPYGKIITSMAVRDDLMSGESYFIKEIKYLNRIIQSLNEERVIICAIDEILRGTNTEERIAASASILKYLNSKNCIAIVASHDIELTQLLNGLYDNYHFCEQIQENDIIFEYKIHEGAATTKNAIRLLELTHFPKEIIANAKNLKYVQNNA
ncbi:MutS-related protein [Anaerocolumna sp.]|uniref:MutS-related protein n=1 Tax=Anaerocolumna sp. TaxID=2041569 RepID=UPI0028A6589A|nr:hypothetical protein [Anaerocolumna sp.]